jgi:peptidoglycan/xylan/chitin deacetylase (PgdA/CDA1 family)
MYHKVGAPVRSKADTFLNVSAESFKRQIRVLRRIGFGAITIEDAARGLRNGTALPPRPICITFDDGYAITAESALSVLREAGWPATVFVPTANVGDFNRWDEPLGHPILPILDWAELKALTQHGWEIGGHTVTHSRLADLTECEAEREMRQGKEELESHLSVNVTSFCYPFGSIGVETPSLCCRAGFRAACTTQSGLATQNTNPFLLPRVKVAYRDSVGGLLYRLLVRPRLP